jgi:C-terminal processing protease CtpA/Prc
MKNLFRLFTIIALFSLLASACMPKPQPTLTVSPTDVQEVEESEPTATSAPETAQEEQAETGPTQITGTFAYSNEFVVETYFVEHAVGLVDMHAFVTRDREWEVPVDSQVLGYLKIDTTANTGAYQLSLPALPLGMFNDLDNDRSRDTGVQVFAVSYWPNLYGGPFSEGDDRSRGWPGYLASIKTDAENHDEVIGGKIIIWAPDAQQKISSGFGADGLLFTMDDPLMTVPAGYSVIDLDQTPFAILRQAEQGITLNEPKDVALKDYSKDSYTQAFQKMYDFIKLNYAFNGVQGKQPDWDPLYKAIMPRIQQAETSKDAAAYFRALQDYTLAFKDGHVQIGGALGQQVYSQQSGSGYGFSIREMDDGKVIVTYLTAGGPAEKAGFQLGDEILTWNGEAISQAIGKVQALSGPFSTALAERFQQARYLLRAPLGQEASVTFRDKDGIEKTVMIAAAQEYASFNQASIYFGMEDSLLPIEFRILDSGVGYIKIASNNDDLGLIVRLFERALKTFTARQVYGVIIDMRANPGGSPLGLAGFLTEKEIPLGTLEYYSETSGTFEGEGESGKVMPNENQYRFSRMVLLVGQACTSACEIEAYGFSQVTGMLVMGQYPSGGVEAEVARGQFSLPEGVVIQVPTGRFVMPDGSIFLEGKGVQPTVRVPITPETVLSKDDAVLKMAEETVLVPAGAGILPVGQPTLATPDEAFKLINQNIPLLEGKARERYDNPTQVGQLYTYTIALDQSTPLAWMNGWCASSNEILQQNLEHIKIQFLLNGQEVPLEKMAKYEGPSNRAYCRIYFTILDNWSAGEHHLETKVRIDQAISDGSAETPQGLLDYAYTVYVKP